MDKRLEKTIQQLQSVHLTTEEKAEVKHRVLSVIDQIEAVSVFGEAHVRPIKSPFVSKIISYTEYKKFAPAFLIAILLLFSGGVSLAAEQALPGDALYGLKKLNEQVLGFAAVTPEAKARLAVEVSERRLQEAATLSARGQLTDQTKSIIQQGFAQQANQVTNQVASLVSENDLAAAQDVALNYESTLKAHAQILAKVSADDQQKSVAEASDISSLLAVVNSAIATSTQSRMDIQNLQISSDGTNVDKTQSYFVDVNQKLQDVLTLRASIGTISSSTATATDQDIAQANDAIAKAKVYIANNQLLEALVTIQQADRNLGDAESVLTAEKDANVDVKKALNNGNSSSSATSSTSGSTGATSSYSSSSTATSSGSQISATTTSTTTIGASSTGTTLNTTNQSTGGISLPALPGFPF